MMRISLRQLECFVAAAEAGTIIGGAEVSGASPAAVSLAVSELERRLGVQLLIRRTAKGVALTEAGQRVLSDARAVLAQTRELEESARSDGTALRGDLTVGCFSTLGPIFLPRLLADFGRRHPEVRLSVAEGTQANLRHMLLEGECEVALVYERGLGPNLSTTVVQRCRPYVMLPVDHPRAAQSEVDLGDLAAEPLITFGEYSSAQSAEKVLEDAGYEARVGFRTTSLEVMRSLVARGLGYAIVVQPWPNGASPEGLPLASLPIADAVAEHRVVVAHAEGVRLTRRAQALIEFCVRTFESPAVRPQTKR